MINVVYNFILWLNVIEGLTAVQKDNILLNLLSNGKGSLDYAKTLVTFGTGDEGCPPGWCVCVCVVSVG